MSLVITEVVNTVTVTGTQTNLTVQDTLAVPAGGDLSGSYPNPTVVKINGVAAGDYISKNIDQSKIFTLFTDATDRGGFVETVIGGANLSYNASYTNISAWNATLFISPGGAVPARSELTDSATAILNFTSNTAMEFDCVCFHANADAACRACVGFWSNTLTSATYLACFVADNSSANWLCVVNDSSTATVVDSGVLNASPKKLSISVNAAGTQVAFKIDGVVVHTATSNIPSGAMRVGAGVRAQSAAPLNTTTLTIEYMQFRYYLNR